VGEYLSKPVNQFELLRAIQTALAAPRDREDNKNMEPISTAIISPKPCKGDILLVEDNEVNQRVAARMLEKEGYRVEVAANGKEALAKLSDRVPDLVLMDLQMPLMDGFEATAEIRRSETGGEHLPIVALTANAMKGDREKCLDAGMDGYIAKPIDKRTLLDEIERLSPARLVTN